MRRRDLRLVPVAAATWATALACVFVPVLAWVSFVGALGIGAGLVVAARLRGPGWLGEVAGVSELSGARGGPRLRWAPLAALACAGAAAVALTCALAGPVRAEVAELDGRIVAVEADVTSSRTTGSDGRAWFDAQTVRIGAAGSERAVSVPVRVGVDGGEGADLGARIRVRGQVMATDASERAALVVFATSAEVSEPADGAFAIAAGTRSAFVARAVRLPEPGAGLLPGLAVGDTTAVTAELNDAMLTSGLSHLTAVSGQDFRHRSPSP